MANKNIYENQIRARHKPPQKRQMSFFYTQPMKLVILQKNNTSTRLLSFCIINTPLKYHDRTFDVNLPR